MNEIEIHKIKNYLDEELVLKTKHLVRQERRISIVIIYHLKEIHRRWLWAERSSSFFQYCTKELCYSETQFYRRLAVLEILEELPEVEEMVVSGEMNLSTVNQVKTFFRREEKRQKKSLSLDEKRKIIAQVRGLSEKATQAELATVSPVAKIPHDKIRRLSAELSYVQYVASNELLAQLERARDLFAHQTGRDSSHGCLLRKVLAIALEKIDPVERAKRQKSKSEKSQASRAAQASTNKVGTSRRHTSKSTQAKTSNPSTQAKSTNSSTQVKASSPSTQQTSANAKSADRLNDASESRSANVKITMRTFKKSNRNEKQNRTRERVLEEQFEFPADALTDTPTSTIQPDSETTAVPTAKKKPTRYIPSATRLGIWLRDEGRCTHVDPITKQKCNATYGLEIDHVEGFACGGTNGAENLRLLCHAHNIRYAIHTYGSSKMGEFVDSLH